MNAWIYKTNTEDEIKIFISSCSAYSYCRQQLKDNSLRDELQKSYNKNHHDFGIKEKFCVKSYKVE